MKHPDDPPGAAKPEAHRLSPDDIAPIVEMSEAEAWNDFFLAAPPEVSKRLGIQTEYYGPTVALIARGLDATLFNRVVGLGILEPADPTTVDAILADYAEAHTPAFAVQLSPYAQPPALPDWLRSNGLVPRDSTAKVYRDAKPPPQVKTDLSVKKIGTSEADAFCAIVCSVYGLPHELEPWLAATIGRAGWQHYMAFDGERPVATAALFVDGNVGWIGFAATLSSDRNRGAQSALMAQRVRDGAAMGCEWFVAECKPDTPEHPDASYHNLLRNGFQLAYLRPNWIRATERPAD